MGSSSGRGTFDLKGRVHLPPSHFSDGQLHRGKRTVTSREHECLLGVGKRPTSLRIHRRKAVSEFPLPGSGQPSPATSDPLPTPQALHTGHRNRSKPPFKLRQRCASILPDWTPANEGKACVHLRPSALRGNRRRGRSHPQRAARTSARIRSAPRLVTRPPFARDAAQPRACGRRTRCKLPDVRATPAPGALRAP